MPGRRKRSNSAVMVSGKKIMILDNMQWNMVDLCNGKWVDLELCMAMDLEV